MAVETVKSTLITNRDAALPVQKLTELAGGVVKSVFALATVAVSASSASKYVFFQVPSNCRLRELKLMCTTTGSVATMDLGLFRTTADGGAVVDQDRLGSAIAISSPILESTYNNSLSESADTAFTDFEKPLWSMLGLSADPGYNYDVVGVLQAAAEVGGTVALELTYV